MTYLLFLLICGLFFVISFLKPEWGLLVLLGIVVFFREGWHPSLENAWTFYNNIKLANIHIFEILILSLIGITLFKKNVLERKPLWLPPFTWVVILFLSNLIFSAFYGYANGASLRSAFGYGEWRILFLTFCLFLVIPMILDNPQKLKKFFTVFFILGVIRCLIGWLTYLQEKSLIHPTLNIPVVFWDSGDNLLLSILIVIAAVQLLLNKKLTTGLIIKVGFIIPMTLAILLSYRRTYWLFLIISLTVVFFLVNTKGRIRYLALMFFGGSLTLGLLAVNFSQPGVARLLQRTESFFTIRADTNRFHIYDLYDAMQTISKSPILGVGMGNGFKRIKTLRYGVMGEAVTTDVVHNAYLLLWLKMGFFGMIFFLILMISFFHFNLQSLKTISGNFDKSIIITGIAVLIGLLGMFFWGPGLLGNTRNIFLMFFVMGSALAVIAHNKTNQSISIQESGNK